MPKTRYRHPIAVLKGSQSTPALRSLSSGGPDAAAAATAAGKRGEGGNTKNTPADGTVRLPPVADSVVAGGSAGALPTGSAADLAEAAAGRGTDTVTNLPHGDEHVIADALAHSTSYSNIDVLRSREEQNADDVEGDPDLPLYYDSDEEAAADAAAAAAALARAKRHGPKDGADAHTKQLKNMVKYWAGAEPPRKTDAERRAEHEARVTELLTNIKGKTKRRLQAPKWVKDKQEKAKEKSLLALRPMSGGASTSLSRSSIGSGVGGGLDLDRSTSTLMENSLVGGGGGGGSTLGISTAGVGGDPMRGEVELARRAKAARVARNDKTYPAWVKDRSDFQSVFHRFAYRTRDLTKCALIAAKMHPEERLPQDTAVMMQWVSQHFPTLSSSASAAPPTGPSVGEAGGLGGAKGQEQEEDESSRDECLELIVNKIRVRTCGAGEQVYAAGEDANVYYLVFRGSVRLDFPVHGDGGVGRSSGGAGVADGGFGETISTVVHATQGFGEEALRVGALRPVAATALENGTVLGTVRGFSFRETRTAYAQSLSLAAKRFLTDSVPLLQGWSTNRLLALAEMSRRHRYLDGDRIGTQGQTVPGLCFVVSGRATIHKEVSYTKANRWPVPAPNSRWVRGAPAEEDMWGRTVGGPMSPPTGMVEYQEVTRNTQVMVEICQLAVGDYVGEECLLGHDTWQGGSGDNGVLYWACVVCVCDVCVCITVCVRVCMCVAGKTAHACIILIYDGMLTTPSPPPSLYFRHGHLRRTMRGPHHSSGSAIVQHVSTGRAESARARAARAHGQRRGSGSEAPRADSDAEGAGR